MSENSRTEVGDSSQVIKLRPPGVAGVSPLSLALLVATLLLLASTIVHTIACYRTGAALDTVSGAWAGLADDLYRGTFYRPLLGELGWGGTRSFPLYFSLHALLMRSGISLIAGGYFLSACSGVLAVLGAYFLLLRLAVAREGALLCALWVLAPLAAQRALASFHPDLLAAGLAACGAAVCLGPGKRRNILGAFLFALAFAAKMTAVSAPMAIFLYWMIRRERRAALQLALLLAVLYAGVLAAMQVASHGRALGVVLASGGTSLRSILWSPRSFWQVLLYDPIAEGLLVLGLFAALFRASTAVGFARMLFLCTFAMTIPIYAAPGASTNHLLELNLATVVLMGTALAGRRARVLALTASLVVVTSAALSLNSVRTLPRRLASVQAAVQAAAVRPGPILAEDPLVPILAGQRPRVLDPFMLNLLAEKHPEIRAALNAELEQHRFAAVMLDHNPDTPQARNWYADSQFGGDFLQQLQRNYVRVHSSSALAVFKPR
jgi:hypothetical protein